MHFTAIDTSIGEIRSNIEMLYRPDDKLGSIGEVKLLVIVLVLAHGKYNLPTVGHIIITANDKRIVIKACSIRIEKRERRRRMTQIAEHILNVAHTNPRII